MKSYDQLTLLELALLSNKPRAATITAKGKLKCATLGKKAFDRLLGPALDIIKRNTSTYKTLAHRKDIQGKMNINSPFGVICFIELVEKIEAEVNLNAPAPNGSH
jgi:tRNA(Ser,Leu) C12 N-acetylase TAN1